MKCRFVTVLALIAGSLALSGPAGAVERHWLAPLTVSPAGEGNGLPALAVNAGGEAVVAWGGGLQAVGAVLAASRPAAGAPWSAAVRLGEPCSPPCVHSRPVLEMNAAGATAVIWSETSTAAPAVTTVWAAVRPSGTETWRTPRLLHTGALASGFAPALAVGVDASGRVTGAWLGADGAAMAVTRSADGAWSDPVSLAGPGPAATALGLVVGSRGDAVATWIADCRPMAAERPAGAGWEPARALDVDDACGEAPAAAIDDAGHAVAAWRHWNGTERVLRVRDLPAAEAPWGPISDLGVAGAPGSFVNPPAITLTSRGAVALWRDTTNTVRVATRPPGGEWSSAEPVPGLGPALGDVAGAVGADGGVALFQASFTYFPRAVVREAGGPWSGPLRLANSPPPPMPAAPTQPAGNPVVYAAAVMGLDGAGDAVLASVDVVRRSINVTDLTVRDGPRFDPGPAPSFTGLTGPAVVPAGAVARLQLGLDRPVDDLLVAVERRSGSGWTVVSRARVSGPGPVEMSARLARPGPATLRVSAVGPTGAPQASRAVTVRVTRPGRPRLPAGPAPGAMAVGEGALWVLGEDAAEATVRRIDWVSGRQVGPVLRIGGQAQAIAAGAGAVWVVRGGGEASTLLRITPRGAIADSHAIPGMVRSVAAAGANVWIAGACLPQRLPSASAGCDRRGAARVDAGTGVPTADPVGAGGQVDSVRIFGRTLWAWGERIGNYDDTVLARADAATGRVAASIPFAGRFGVPLLPVSATAVWQVNRQAIRTAYPGPERTLYGARQYRRLTAAPAGRLVWVLERRALTKVLATSRLLALDARTGARVGRPIELGQSELQDQGLAVTRDAVWVLRPTEGTLMRIPIPPALR